MRAMAFWGVHPKTSRAVGLENTASHSIESCPGGYRNSKVKVRVEITAHREQEYWVQPCWVCEPGMRLHGGRYVTWDGGSLTVNKLDQ